MCLLLRWWRYPWPCTGCSCRDPKPGISIKESTDGRETRGCAQRAATSLWVLRVAEGRAGICLFSSRNAPKLTCTHQGQFPWGRSTARCHPHYHSGGRSFPMTLSIATDHHVPSWWRLCTSHVSPMAAVGPQERRWGHTTGSRTRVPNLSAPAFPLLLQVPQV